jgi:hypothetical protein
MLAREVSWGLNLLKNIPCAPPGDIVVRGSLAKAEFNSWNGLSSLRNFYRGFSLSPLSSPYTISIRFISRTVDNQP